MQLVVPTHSEQCTPLGMTSVPSLHYHTVQLTPSHGNTQPCDRRASATSLEKELQRGAGKHFPDLKSSLKQVSLSEAVQQGASHGDILCWTSHVPTANHGLKGMEKIFTELFSEN